MKSPRVLAFLLWLAVAFLAGQQGALLHGLSHAVQKEAPSPTTPCGDCAAASQLGGMPGATGLPDVAMVAAVETPLVASESAPRVVRVAAFQPRGPPTLL